MSSVPSKNHTFVHKFDFSKSSVSKENQKELEALLLSYSPTVTQILVMFQYLNTKFF